MNYGRRIYDKQYKLNEKQDKQCELRKYVITVHADRMFAQSTEFITL